MSENLCKRHRDLDKYYSSNYLITWCNNVKEEWTEFLHRAFCEVIPNVFENEVTCLDVGCGPSIANVIQGDPNQNPLFQMALSLKRSISDPMFVKSKLV